MSAPPDSSNYGKIITKEIKASTLSSAINGASSSLNLVGYTSDGAYHATAKLIASSTRPLMSLESNVPGELLGIENLALPVNPNDAASKSYVDAVATGLTTKNSCAVMYSSNVSPVDVDLRSFTLDQGVGQLTTVGASSIVITNGTAVTINAIGASPTDGSDLLTANRIFFNFNMVAHKHNGIFYLASCSGSTATFVRTTDVDMVNVESEIQLGVYTLAMKPAPAVGYVISALTAPPNTLGNPITFTQFSQVFTPVGSTLVKIDGSNFSIKSATADGQGKPLVSVSDTAEPIYSMDIGRASSAAITGYADIPGVPSTGDSTGALATGGFGLKTSVAWTNAGGSVYSPALYMGDPTVAGCTRTVLKESTTADAPEYKLQQWDGSAWSDIAIFTR